MRIPGFLRQPMAGAIVAIGLTALLTAALVPFRETIGLLNEGLLFLLLTLLVASTWGRNTGLLTAVVTNVALNFFFIEPYYRPTVDDPKNVVALFVFLIVSIVGSSLLATAREALGQARRRQAETEVALNLSRAMSGQTEPQQALESLCREVISSFSAPGAAVLTESEGRWSVLAHVGSEAAARLPDAEERSLLARAMSRAEYQGLGETGFEQGRKRRIIQPAGQSQSSINRERSVALVPLNVGGRVLGILRLDGPIGNTVFREQPQRLLNAVASEAALAVQRAELAKAAAHAEALREADEMKTALLNAVSHDLRTPLASIIASAGSLQQTDVNWTERERQEFAEAIEHEAQRLNGLVGNLLDLSRIESGSLRPDKGFYDLGALIDEVVGRLKSVTTDRAVRVIVPANLPPVPLDYIEIDDVLSNLIENATKYSPAGTEIEVRVEPRPGDVIIHVTDRGPGILPDALKRVFEPFFRANGTRVRGTGLGLAVAKGLVEAHGGRIWAENNQDGGATFTFTLPTPGTQESPSGEDRRK